MGRKFFLIPLIAATSAFAAVGQPSPASDPQVAAAQELLQKAQLYTGEINGMLDQQTEIALRHFQMLRNLAVTGKMDDSTVEQLHLPPRNMVLADREFLKDTLPPVAEPPEQNAPSAAGKPPAGDTRPPGAMASKEIQPALAQNFLRHYLKAASYKKAKPELSYFADSVDFFDHGPVTREQLEAELSRNRSNLFALEKVEQVTPATKDTASIRFSVRITPLVRSGRKKTTSYVETREATLTRMPEGMLKLTSIKKIQ